MHMKKIIFFLLWLKVSLSFSQSTGFRDNSGDSKVMLSILSDVKMIANTNQNEQSNQKTGVGSLGVSYRKGQNYGSILFNVFNRNKSLSSNDTQEVKIFSNNLLIPENSGQGISSFFISFGHNVSINKIREGDKLMDRTTRWIQKRLDQSGIYGYWQTNNTLWTKDTISINTTIHSIAYYILIGA